MTALVGSLTELLSSLIHNPSRFRILTRVSQRALSRGSLKQYARAARRSVSLAHWQFYSLVRANAL
jgi:hypothetical protein